VSTSDLCFAPKSFLILNSFPFLSSFFLQRAYSPSESPIVFNMDLTVHEDVMIQCFHFSVTGVQKLFRLQFFIGCLEKNTVRFEKEELDDACKNSKFPDDSFVELQLVDFQESPGPHVLESFIPEDLHLKTGNTCYFDDPELNAKYA